MLETRIDTISALRPPNRQRNGQSGLSGAVCVQRGVIFCTGQQPRPKTNRPNVNRNVLRLELNLVDSEPCTSSNNSFPIEEMLWLIANGEYPPPSSLSLFALFSSVNRSARRPPEVFPVL